jgi:Icc protein
VQITDTHIQSQSDGYLGNVNVDAGLKAVLKHIEQHRRPVDFILATGDLVQDEGAPAYRRFRQFTETLGAPVHCLAGNHDPVDIFKQELSTGLVRWQRSVLAGAWQFILLDSSQPDSPGGHLVEGELAFLSEALADHPERHTMVCLHHHPVPIGSSWMDTMIIDNADDFWSIVDRHAQVRAVIWGHIHQAFDSQRRGVHLLGTPSTCLQFKPERPDPQFDETTPGYRWFELSDDGSLHTGVERIALLPSG